MPPSPGGKMIFRSQCKIPCDSKSALPREKMILRSSVAVYIHDIVSDIKYKISCDNKSPPPRVERYFYEVQWPPISSTKSLVIVNLPLPRVLPPNGKMILRGPVAA